MLKRFLLALILLVGACAPIEPREPSAFEQVCEALEADEVVSCDGVYEPEIIVTIMLPVLAGPWLHGMTVYEEERIFINAEATIPLDIIIIHEMVHWVVRQGSEIIARCESEALARKYTERLTGHPPGNWRDDYGCLGRSQGPR